MNTHAAPPPPPPEPHEMRTDNSAGPGSVVGIQASVVHNANVYQISATDPPEKKYRTGVRYLEDGVPRKAEELFSEAMADGLDTAEVRFHWALSMFSARSDRDLTKDERARLTTAAERFVAHEDDEEYGPALGAVRELIIHRLDPSAEGIELAEKRILALPGALRERSLRHLDKVLSAATKDNVWANTKKQALLERHSGSRGHRVWAYFEADPAGPRARPAQLPHIAPGERARIAAGTLLCALTVGYLGWLTLSSAAPVAIVAYALALAAAWVTARNAFEWRYRVKRLRWEEQRRRASAANGGSDGRGFAAGVTRSFEFYFSKYRPRDHEKDWWLAETAGLRTYLRDEIVEIYRESHVSLANVVWLIRYHAIDVQKQWRAGTIDDHKVRFQIADRTKILCVLGLTILLLTVGCVIQNALQAQPAGAAVATFLAVAGGLYTARKWHRVASGRRHYIDDLYDEGRRREGRENEFRRWTQRLKDARPSEEEMETWLRSDTTILIADALEHFRISWRDVISYAVLRVPTPSASRAQERNGPLRYNSYALRLFLITEDGVREVSKVLNFETGAFNSEERNTFRFDAVSSVNVVKGADGRQNLRLTLTNGPTRDILVTKGQDLELAADDLRNPERPDTDADVEPDNPLDTSLDTTGFAPTLRILEGIAADGKNWIARGNY
ncbi:hypothetical protein GCM10010413_34490 [Promicromonospora sukumoe]|uniref:Uncharacterized protein n=1 Tax=Promicromonospora sukumoe TaxID=88382 RepID=A0A7W3J750_9MICO|nr:hypothetical protein [Promicromonospora sukumoe]MBA8807394.1 hypothetical protein [Promicromonospora sukumoe]